MGLGSMAGDPAAAAAAAAGDSDGGGSPLGLGLVLGFEDGFMEFDCISLESERVSELCEVRGWFSA